MRILQIAAMIVEIEDCEGRKGDKDRFASEKNIGRRKSRQRCLRLSIASTIFLLLAFASILLLLLPLAISIPSVCGVLFFLVLCFFCLR